MLIALSREQIHVGRRIFTLESRPFPGRSVYVAQKPLGASGNTWSLQRPKERLGAGFVPRQERWGMPLGFHGRAVAPGWALPGLVQGSNPEIPEGSQGSGSSCE